MPGAQSGGQRALDTVDIDVDGEPMRALRGRTLLGAMIADGRWIARRHPVTGEPRGGYCGMGVCFECECDVNGQLVRACMVSVDGPMTVRTWSDSAATDPGAAG